MSRFDSFTVIDLETTGLDPRNCEIIELGAARYENGSLKEKFSQLVKPSAPIPEEIIRLTGIDNDMVKAAPSIDSVFEDFQKRLEGSTWVVGHNISFDLSFWGECGFPLVAASHQARITHQSMPDDRLECLGMRRDEGLVDRGDHQDDVPPLFGVAAIPANDA